MKQITERQYQLMKAKTQRLERIILCRDNELQSKEAEIRKLCARITELEKQRTRLKQDYTYQVNRNSRLLTLLDSDEAWKQPKGQRPVTEKPVNELTDQEINELIELKRKQ